MGPPQASREKEPGGDAVVIDSGAERGAVPQNAGLEARLSVVTPATTRIRFWLRVATRPNHSVARRPAYAERELVDPGGLDSRRLEPGVDHGTLSPKGKILEICIVFLAKM